MPVERTQVANLFDVRLVQRIATTGSPIPRRHQLSELGELPLQSMARTVADDAAERTDVARTRLVPHAVVPPRLGATAEQSLSSHQSILSSPHGSADSGPATRPSALAGTDPEARGIRPCTLPARGKEDPHVPRHPAHVGGLPPVNDSTTNGLRGIT